jgi:hypothetical protein
MRLILNSRFQLRSLRISAVPPDNLSMREFHFGKTLALPPATFSTVLAETRTLSDSRARGDRLDIGDFAKDLKMHIPCFQSDVNQSM